MIKRWLADGRNRLVAGAALLALAMVSSIIYLFTSSGESPQAAPQASSKALTFGSPEPGPGRFKDAPAACSLLTTGQREELAPLAEAGERPATSEGCAWSSPGQLPASQRYGLTIALHHVRPTEGKEVSQAHDQFSAAASAAKRGRIVRGIGNAAFASEGADGDQHQVNVVVRASNIVATVTYARWTASDQRMRDNAVKAARWVTAALNAQSAPVAANAETGRFPKAPGVCTLVGSGSVLDDGACWQGDTRVKLWHAPPWRGKSGPEVAKATFALFKKQAAADAGDTEEPGASSSTGQLQPIKNLGDEAFTQEEGGMTTFGSSTNVKIWIRVSNLVIEIERQGKGRTVTAGVRKSALKIAQRAVKNLG